MPNKGSPGAAQNPAPKNAGQSKAKGVSTAVSMGDIAKALNIAKSRDLVRRIEEMRGSRVVSLVYNEKAPVQVMLAPPLIRPLESLFRSVGRTKKIDLFLRTTGGMTEVPWRIVSLLREFADEVGVIVSGMAYSGGTHIAIAADDLVMTPFSVIGSVDPTRRHPLLPKDANGNPIPTSVQDLKHCIEFIREQLGESQDSQSLAKIISELFQYVNPLAIGALEQSYNLSRLITRKALRTRREELAEEAIDHIEETLAGKYFSHSFLISREDVEQDLGLSVTKPDNDFLHAIEALQAYYDGEFKKAVELDAPGQDPNPSARIAAFAETTEERWGLLQVAAGQKLLQDPWLELDGGGGA